MNKYTLRFYSNSLEQTYQEQQQNVYIPLFYSCSIGTFIAFISKLFLSLFLYNLNSFIELKVTCIVILGLTIIFVKQKSYLAKYGIIIINATLLGFQYDINYKSQVNSFMAGQSFMMLLDLLMLASDFDIGILNNFLVFTGRVSTNLMQSEEVYYFGIFHALLFHSFLIVFLYLKSRYSRQNYLISRQDQVWDVIMPHLVTRPFFIFYYDRENIKFQQKSAITQNFLPDSDQPLITFLREAKINDMSLEKYLHTLTNPTSSIKMISDNFVQMRVKFQNEIRQISLGRFLLATQIFILVIEDEDEIMKKYKNKINQEKKKQHLFYTKLIKKQDKVLEQVVNKSSLLFIIRLRLQYQQILMLPKLAEKMTQSVNVNKLILKIISQFSLYSGQIRLLTLENIIIKTQKYMFYFILLDIFRKIQLNSNLVFIELYFGRTNQLHISIKGQLSNQQSKIVNQISELLLECVMKGMDRTVYRFYSIPLTRFS